MKFLVETEGDFDEYSILDALSDIFPKDEFKVTEVKDFTFENWCESVSDCTEDEVNCVECSSVAKNATVQKRIELVEE